MLTAIDNTGQTSRYTYDAAGNRTRRQIASSQEEWQIYGMEGELVAEYRASSPASAPEKEYGYRDGQLLITATGRFNVALAANGAVATASSTATGSGFSTAGAINGNYRGPWGNGEGWNDNTPNSVPDWIQVDFAGSKTIDEISVFGLHDNYTVENTPTETQTFTLYGLLAFDVQYWNGSSWTTVPGGSVTGNNKVWRKFTFSPITTSKIRVTINSVPDAWSRVVEIQAFGTSAGGEKVQWLVPDHLGTPRIILDQTGALANVKRHDYLPFGEELFAGTGGRTVAQGYGDDGVRQQFTSKERDVETGLDYFGARYYSSLQGRFTSADPLMASGRASVPQSWNRYSIVLNNPSKLIDPNGLEANDPQEPKKKEDPKPTKTPLPKVTVTMSTDPRGSNGTEPKVNVPLPDGDYATGIIAPLTITVTDESGEPLKGLTITETNKVIEAEPELPFMENTKTVTTDSNGSFTDLVYSNATITSEPVSGEAAAKIIKNQRENRSRFVTEQTLTIADGQEVIATAVYRRTFTNLDNKGNLRSPINKAGRPVNNFSISVEPVTVSPPKSP
jgi:RHS repeat-associated protein